MAGRERKAFWRFDRDQTTRVSTERAARRQPVADPASPVSDARRSERPSDAAGPHAAQLRGALDNGLGADKIAFPDPAAAPLGTDDEAAGSPPTPAAVATAMRHEMRPGVGPRELPDPDRGWRLGIVLSVVAGLAFVAVAAAILS